MNQSWLFIFCVATLVSSTVSQIICNGAPGLRESSGNTVACYSAQKGGVKEYLCDWSSCSQATATNCEINNHAYTPTEVFTCDKGYNLPIGIDDKINCNVNTDYNKKCGGKYTEPCLASPADSYFAQCKTISVHSHCTKCNPI
ncbi:uncharacterized protein MELLADRAFT_124113 [Melampsora larici-populina 98AG31]|uniref:Secreted protein n=1 Tax=Melampsora larici-populina (strain 98AG31 / pathotype 3-4-7) TaxID=747676 RepID=F4RWD8_MELLP|nr:uncharacterized protein MELLADRAFT_124113 [Melampsora larici-populina 98AG31]EGG03339.1 secreted protein [Melampsora larici-populina 98AG31]